MRSNAKKFLTPDNCINLDTSGANNNVIEVECLEYAVPSTSVSSDKNPVYCSIQGVEIPQTTNDKIDDTLSIGSFIYLTDSTTKVNKLKFIVDKAKISNICEAKKYITGILVDYQIATVSYAGTEKDKIYECDIYLSDMTFVNGMRACTINEIINKAQTLEHGLDINRTGWYDIHFRRALIQK